MELVQTDKLYMQRCLDIARWAEGNTAPNPMVGAILVYQDRIIGEGFHHKAGTPHAEVNCFASVTPQDEPLIAHSTLYVSLEPCSHFGKTPPCVDLILNKKVPRVVIAMEDPFPQVAGRGIKKLQEAGVEVSCGVLEREAKTLNCSFLSAIQKDRPFITLKWAESSDGFIDKIRTSKEQKAFVFSSPLRQRIVHRLRATHDAILVGNTTVEKDNPSLTNRYWWGNNPIRVVIDPYLSLEEHEYILFNSSTPTLIYSFKGFSRKDSEYNTYIPLEEKNFLQDLLKDLIKRGIHSLLVEGGAKTLQNFIDKKLFDQIDREISSISLGTGIPAPHSF